MDEECHQDDEMILIPFDRSNLWKKKLKPVIITLKIWGMYVDHNCCQSFWSMLILIYVHFHIIFMILHTCKVIYFNESFMTAINDVIALFMAFNVLMTYYKLHFFMQQLNFSLSTISNHNFLEFADYRVGLRDKFRMIIFWFYCLSHCLYIVYALITNDIHNYYENKLHGFDPDILPKFVAYLIVIIIEFSFIFFVRAAEKLMCFYYASISRFISAEFSYLRYCVNSLSTNWNREPGRQRLLLSMDRYTDLCDIIGFIDVAMSSLLFLWTSSLAIQITFDGNHICKTVNFCKEPVFCIQYFLEFLIVLITFIDVFMSSSSVTSEAQELGPTVYKIAGSPECFGKDHLRSRIGLWYWKIITDPPKFTGFGAFGINRSCLLNILGIIITFIAIMYELA